MPKNPLQLFPILLLLVFSVVLSTSPAHGTTPDPNYLQELIGQARSRALWKERPWTILLHYEPRYLLLPARSLADDPDFFNAAEGATDPQAELEATLAAFFSEAEIENQHPQCRFAARYHWLNEALGFDASRLPRRPCPELEEFLSGLEPQRATLVFPSAYMNNPASMFGHTLLRIDAPGQDEKTRLLAYSASYAAATGSDGGIAFAVKGLLGGYNGSYAVEPYYHRVTMYSDIENRDIWEYQLSLEPHEVRRMLLHLWELMHTDFTYYFFDENCSYYLLALLEFARPSLMLRDEFRVYAIPSDTVRAVAEEPGLVEEVVYRPAVGTAVRYKLGELRGKEAALARTIAESSEPLESVNTLPPDRAALVLEVVSDLLAFQLQAKQIIPDEEADLSYQVLRLRSRLGTGRKSSEPPMPDVRPDEGHEVARLTLGGGNEEGRWYEELRIRPAYHDLLDPEGGYTRGAQINFFAATFRHYEGDELELEQFLPVEIVSLAPRDELFSPISWKVGGGIERKRTDGDLGKLVLLLEGGPGVAYDLWGRVQLYGFVESSLNISRHFDEEDFALGFGPSAGALVDMSDSVRLGVQGRALRFGIGSDHSEIDTRAALRVTLRRELALELEVGRRGEFEKYWNRAAAFVHYYF